MLKLFKIEWSKLLQSRSFRVLLGIYVIVYTLFLLVLSSMFDRFSSDILQEVAKNIDYNPFTFPDIWILTAYLAQPFTLLAAIIVIVLVVNEFDFRTARQHIIDGLTRWEFVLGKFITVVTISVIVTVLIFLLGSFTGLFKDPSNSPTGYGISLSYFIAFFVRTVGLLTFAMFLAMWIKRTGVTILIFIVLHLGLFAAIVRNRLDESIGDALPMGTFNRLIRLFRPDDTIIQNYEQLKLTDMILIAPTGQFVVSLIYIAAFVGLSYMVIRRNDLK